MDKQLECAMLGQYISGNYLEDIDKFEVTDFKDENCRKLFEEIRKHPNISAHELSRACGMNIGEVMGLTSTEVTNERWYKEAHDKLVKDKRISILMNNASMTADEIIEVASKYREKTQTLPEPERDLTLKYLETLDRRSSMELVNTGFTLLDDTLCGIRTGDLTSIGGRPASGKSALALDIAINVSGQGKKVMFFTLEMSVTQISDRRMVRGTDIMIERLRKGNLSREEWEKINVAADEMYKEEKEGNLLFFICNRIEVMEQLIDKYKPYLIIIDQLEQLRSSGHFRDKRERFSYMTNNLKRITLEKDVAVMLLCQLNRDAQDKEPTLANMKESGSIEEDSDNVILLHAVDSEYVDYGGSFSGTLVHMNLAKHRNGETDKFFVGFDKKHCKYVNIGG